MAIQAFKQPGSDTEKTFKGEKTPKAGWANIQKTSRRKLLLIDTATNLDDLRVPPGNRLKPLSDDREGQHSIRINDQWRVCFIWGENGPYDVEIVDYH